MPKFKEGDRVFFTPNKLEGTPTEEFCGLASPMGQALSKCEMEVVEVNDFSETRSVRLHTPRFGTYSTWWFHEDDLEFFNLSLENK